METAIDSFTRKNLKDSGFYINEDLTKSNQKLFYTARVKCVNSDAFKIL